MTKDSHIATARFPHCLRTGNDLRILEAAAQRPPLQPLQLSLYMSMIDRVGPLDIGGFYLLDSGLAEQVLGSSPSPITCRPQLQVLSGGKDCTRQLRAVFRASFDIPRRTYRRTLLTGTLLNWRWYSISETNKRKSRPSLSAVQFIPCNIRSKHGSKPEIRASFIRHVFP